MATRKTKTRDFEKSLADLESVVSRLENGELPLEEALRQFELGVELARTCQADLRKAEQKVEILLKKTPEAEPETFEPEN